MRKAASICIPAALFAAAVSAQEVVEDDYEGHFGWHEDEGQEAGGAPRDEGPRSIAEAKEQGRGYRIGAHGAHATVMGGKDVHVVVHGDTLWDISGHYFGSPWHWPELWSYNPEVTNPHWIYPLDQVRLTPDKLVEDKAVAKAAATGGFEERGPSAGVLSGTESAPSVVVPPELMQPGTIFLRDEGYLDPDALRRAGQIIGGNEEHMMLSPSDQVYVKFRNEEDVRAGQAYTIFRSMKKNEREENEKGELVRILGTVVIRSYDREKKVARGVLTEGLDPIERGLFVAKMDRRFDLVTPKRNESNVAAHIIASVQPRRLISYGNVVFLDVGQGHGIQPGNRFFVVRRGDEWLSSLQARPTELGNVAEVPPYKQDQLPKEVVAELRVLKVRKETTIAVVIRSDTDIRIGDSAEMRVGF